MRQHTFSQSIELLLGTVLLGAQAYDVTLDLSLLPVIQLTCSETQVPTGPFRRQATRGTSGAGSQRSLVPAQLQGVKS